ncbi:MAG TPA: HAD-IIA family hydrolase [Propionibacteriaceae bacterium]|nr:HAD-IIA family hydrolase [Propionibacteriaceae bacterium]
MSAVIDAYDAALFDLDGVIYLGDEAVPGVAAAIRGLRERGVRLGFVTNNAARSPHDVADHLQRLGVDATAEDIVTSAQAVARLMAARFPAGAPVLVAGTEALEDEIRTVGLVPVASSTDNPVAVVVGYAPQLTWARINDACFAVQAGAEWYGCNPDRTRPQLEGQAIGLGTMLDAMRETMPGKEPILAGKPLRPLLDETLRRLGATRPIFVGDRLDTDIEGAHVVGIDSLFVLSGSHGPEDLLAAPPDQRPTYIAADISGLLQEPVGTGDGPLDELWQSVVAAWHDRDRSLRDR